MICKRWRTRACCNFSCLCGEGLHSGFGITSKYLLGAIWGAWPSSGSCSPWQVPRTINDLRSCVTVLTSAVACLVTLPSTLLQCWGTWRIEHGTSTRTIQTMASCHEMVGLQSFACMPSIELIVFCSFLWAVALQHFSNIAWVSVHMMSGQLWVQGAYVAMFPSYSMLNINQTTLMVALPCDRIPFCSSFSIRFVHACGILYNNFYFHSLVCPLSYLFELHVTIRTFNTNTLWSINIGF